MSESTLFAGSLTEYQDQAKTPQTGMDLSEISSSLYRSSDGIWYSENADQVSYPRSGHMDCYSLEDDSFWFAHRNECIGAVVDAYPPPNSGAIFDVGGGNGVVASKLQSKGYPMILVEPGVQGAMHAAQRGIENVVCATTDSAKFHAESMPAIGLFDVIEHTRDDRAFMQEIRTLLTPGGRLYATVPAYSFLWSSEDVEAGHYRRYTLKSFCRLLNESGLVVEHATYMFRFLPLPILLRRTLPYRVFGRRHSHAPQKKRRDHVIKRGFLGTLVARLLSSEVRAIEELKPIRFGGSCLVVARRPPLIPAGDSHANNPAS